MGRSVRVKLVEPKSIADLGLNHREQIDLLQIIQDKIVEGETGFLKSAADKLS